MAAAALVLRGAPEAWVYGPEVSGVRERLISALVAVGDRLTPKHAEIVLRTGPDFDDQGRELVAALSAAGAPEPTWLVSTAPGPSVLVPAGCRVVPARSPAGIRSYWRARVVVHTHGIYGARAGSGRKVFVNIWHGMPIKTLPTGSSVGRNQTDLTLATSAVHAANLVKTWDLRSDQVVLSGLPRNDVLARPPAVELPLPLAERRAARPLIVWLPTFRRMTRPARGAAEVDGVDSGTVTQFDGGTLEAVNEVFARLDVHVIVKPHPLAPRPDSCGLSHVEVWNDEDLVDSGLSLYGLLAHSDVLISDISSVWVDYILTQRPMVFAISDLEEYDRTRGLNFEDIEGLVPGPLVSDLAELERELAAVVSDQDRWKGRRREALEFHHHHVDAHSAARVAALIALQLETGAGSEPA